MKCNVNAKAISYVNREALAKSVLSGFKPDAFRTKSFGLNTAPIKIIKTKDYPECKSRENKQFHASLHIVKSHELVKVDHSKERIPNHSP